MGRRTAAVLLCAALLFSACGSDPAPESTTGEPPDPGRAFSIVTEDDLQLEALAWGSGEEYVILAHMRPADMSSWFDFARVLADEGYTAVAFNFRGYGESGGRSSNTGLVRMWSENVTVTTLPFSSAPFTTATDLYDVKRGTPTSLRQVYPV